jgi:two-component system chemotaxis response regulator CheB
MLEPRSHDEHTIGEAAPALTLVVVVASAGGLEVFLDVISTLPEFRVPIAVMFLLHRTPHAPLAPLVQVLQRRTPWLVKKAEGEERIQQRRVYVAPSAVSVTVRPNRTFGMREPATLPSRFPGDELLSSAATALGAHAMGVILSGANDDGANGVVAIKRHGGHVLIQSPETASFPWMPWAAISTGAADVIARPGAIGAELLRLATCNSG